MIPRNHRSGLNAVIKVFYNFTAFCWHDLPGLIKACDYRINALPTPASRVWVPSPHAILVTCGCLCAGEEALTQTPPARPGCFRLLENPTSTGRRGPAWTPPKTWPPLPPSSPHSSLWKGDRSPAPGQSPGATGRPAALPDNVTSPEKIWPHASVFLSLKI